MTFGVFFYCLAPTENTGQFTRRQFTRRGDIWFLYCLVPTGKVRQFSKRNDIWCILFYFIALLQQETQDEAPKQMTLGGLRPGSSYNICVHAMNEYGNSTSVTLTIATLGKCLSVCSLAHLYGCISELLHVYTPSRTLRSSSDTRILKIQQYKCKTHGVHTFSCFGPHIWNSLPQDLRHCSTLSSFKAKLKIFLFSQYFRPN